jgi:hypothetical protein
MPIGISLEWHRCRDGYRIVDYSKGGVDRDGEQRVGKFIEARSDEVEILQFGGTGGGTKSGKSLVVRFIEARGTSGLLAFADAFGLPGGVDFEAGGAAAYEGHDAHPLKYVLQMQDELRAALQEEGTDVFNLITLKAGLHLSLTAQGKNPPQLVLTPNTLFSGMVAEIALVRSGGGHVMSCLHCGALFITGAQGGKRMGTFYCSGKCKVAAHRARKK